LSQQWVLAVSGTHGKTSTSSMLTWILEEAGLMPNFLIGGVPENFGVSARFNSASSFFVVESDEYDSAFFDKRAKLVHYKPRTWVLNNLEFDHADIYENLAQIQRQFHHGVRLIPASGLIVVPDDDGNVEDTLEMGCWSTVAKQGPGSDWSYRLLSNDASHFQVLHQQTLVGHVQWQLLGEFNIRNAMSALIAAQHAGVPIALACDALSRFLGVARRLTCLSNGSIVVYEDFAHHPTAIAATLQGLRAKHAQQRLIVVLEPRSNSMRKGVFKDVLPSALSLADVVIMYRDPSWDWDIDTSKMLQHNDIESSYDELVQRVLSTVIDGDVVVCMSNGGFGGVPKRISELLK
jgi:UDP-N-acetylmuramate: L-alanyl-gamma-D-glutamyl-meso-diaminopimelate ligase